MGRGYLLRPPSAGLVSPTACRPPHREASTDPGGRNTTLDSSGRSHIDRTAYPDGSLDQIRSKQLKVGLPFQSCERS